MCFIKSALILKCFYIGVRSFIIEDKKSMPKAITNTKVTQRKYVENSSDDSDDGDGPPPFCCPSGLSDYKHNQIF